MKVIDPCIMHPININSDFTVSGYSTCMDTVKVRPQLLVIIHLLVLLGKVEVSPDATFTSITPNGIETAAVPISELPAAREDSEPVLSEVTFRLAYR